MSSGATEITHESLLEVTSPEARSPEHDDLSEAGLSKDKIFQTLVFSVVLTFGRSWFIYFLARM